jgi:molybdopterin/thiamine biosynthesis adenylyltransferase
MNRREFYKRMTSVFRPEVLGRRCVVVVGVGSGGSRAATELGRLGTPLVLIDLPGEKLEEHNIVRHELGYASLGKSKVTELARHIHNLNPDTPIECVELDVVTQRREFALLVERHHPDLLLLCTDNEPSKYVVNEVAVANGIPVVGAGVYDGGVAGEVFIVRRRAACFGCIAEQLQLQTTGLKKKLNLDYNNLDLAEIRSTAALNLDIAQIALIQARVALNLLLASEPDLLGLPPKVNLIVFANRLVPGHFWRPLHAEFFYIRRNPACLVCGNRTEATEAEAKRIRRSLEGEI